MQTCPRVSHIHSSSIPAHSSSGKRCQVGDIEAGTRDETVRYKSTTGDNKRMMAVFRREREQMKRQSEGGDTDGIMTEVGEKYTDGI